ncbi:MAG: hypothetical protein OWU84_09965 [Firmicutes bacterium]|nr:hypothetical protein [Bacillota bacterium]
MPKQKVTKAAGLALGSSMMLMSLIPATSVLAASGPTNNPYITSVTTTVSGDTATASSVSQPAGLHVWYQFQVETPSGHWFIARRFGPGNTYTFVPPVSSSGTWMIEAYALTQYQVAKKMWGAAVGSTPEALSPQVSTVSIQGAPTTDISVDDVITLTAVADNRDNNVVTLNQQATWTVTTASGGSTSGATVQALASGDEALFEATTPGDYTVTTTLDGLTSSTTIDVYGEAAGVQLTSQSGMLVADGSASDVITATVVDANGNVVSNFNGTASVVLTGDPSVHANTGTVTFTNGVGSFTIAGTATGNVTVALSNLTPAPGIPVGSQLTYAATTVTLVAPEPVGLMLSPSAPTLLASPNESATVTVNLVDQDGNLIPANFASGFEVVTLNISGPGSFTPGTVTTSETVYVAPGLSWTATVYDPAGASGTIAITATAPGLTAGFTQLTAEPVGIPAQIAVSEATGITSTALTSSANGINLSAGTEYTKYTVTLEDASGTPVPAPTAETFTVTDNAVTGKAYLLTSLTGVASAITAMAGDTAQVTMNADQSSTTFYVVNTTTQSQPAELTIATTNDYAMVSPVSAVLSASASASYSFVTGPAATVDLMGPGRIPEGQSGTYTAMVADINNNRVVESGSVTFDIAGDGTFANGATTLTEPLNGQGLAAVTVYASSGATGTIALTATIGTFTSTMTINVEDLASLVTNLAVETGSPLAPVPASGLTLSGLSSQTFTVYELNGVNSVVAPTDNVTVSVSNANTLILENGTSIVAGSTLTLPASAFTSNSGATFTVLGGSSGTATVTVADSSNPAVPAVSFPVTVDALTVSAASLTGAGNVPGGIATITVNGLPTYAYYADNVADFASYNQATGVLEMLTPEITSATAVGIYDEATDSYVPNTGNAPLAVWDINGTYYYLVLDEPANLAVGLAPNTAYVGLQVTAPTGSRVQMAVNSGAWDGNTGNTDVDYVPVASKTTTGWTVVPSKSFTLTTQVSLPSPGPTLVYHNVVQVP